MHNCTELAIIKNLLFSSASIFENNITDIVLGITLKEAICIGIIDSLNFVKKFSIKKGEKKNPENAIKIETKIKIFFNLTFFSPLTSLGSKYLYEIEEIIIIIVKNWSVNAKLPNTVKPNIGTTIILSTSLRKTEMR